MILMGKKLYVCMYELLSPFVSTGPCAFLLLKELFQYSLLIFLMSWLSLFYQEIVIRI